MTKSLTPLTVVLLNWNLPGDTIACIESIQAGHLSNINIVIVDNGSTDDSVSQFRTRFGDRVEIIENGRNLGFAAGVNVGITHGLANGAGSILLLNNDTIIAPDMIAHLLNAAEQQPQAGLLGPVIYYHQAPERVWRYADRELAWLPIPVAMSEAELARRGSAPFKVDYVTACGVLIRRDVVETVGLLDERYFMYFEDADYCRRVRQAGYEIWCAPQAKMWHKVSLSAQKDKPANRYAQAWGRVRFYRDYPHGTFPGLIHLYLIFKLLWMTLGDAFRGDRNLIGPSWMGTINGYREK